MSEHDETIAAIMAEERCTREEAEVILADAIQAEIEDGDWRKDNNKLWIVDFDAGTIDGVYDLGYKMDLGDDETPQS